MSYVIRPHIDQNTQESQTTARVPKENGLSHQEKGRSVRKRHGVLKGPRGNTTPAWKGLTSWLSFVMYNCEFVSFQLVSWVRFGLDCIDS